MYPSSPLSTLVSHMLLPDIFVPFHELNETMMAMAPALMAAWNGGRCTARISASVISLSPWSMPPITPVPQVVPPAPRACLGHDITEPGAPRKGCWYPFTAAVTIGDTSAGSSPKLS